MEIIEEKPNDPHNPPMETEEIVSVLEREFLAGRPPLHSLPIAHLLPHTPEEAFAAKHMPDLGHDVKESQVFHWKLQGWKKLDKKLTSSEFDCGGHKWYVFPNHRSLAQSENLLRRILLFPFGNSNAPPNDTVSVYLDYANPKGVKEGWHACAQFALVISNPNDPTIYTVSRK